MSARFRNRFVRWPVIPSAFLFFSMATPGLTEPVFNFVPQGRRRHEGATASSWNFLKNEHLDKFERVEQSKSVRTGGRAFFFSDDETHFAAAIRE
jgi:hypothetical protein